MNNALALLNGTIYTMDGRKAEAVITSGELISRTGSTGEIRDLCNNRTEIIDLKGKAVLPGFSDSHLHILSYGLLLDAVKLEGSRSIEEIVQRGIQFIKERNKLPGDWISGWGWNQNLFGDQRFPTKGELDRISTAHPIIYERVCGHMAVANSLAIKIVGITSDTIIVGGEIDRDSDGNPTGVLREAAVGWFRTKITKPGVDEIKRLIRRSAHDALKVGLTSLHTSDLHRCGSFDDMYNAYISLKDEGNLEVRIYEELYLPGKKSLLQLFDKGFRTGDGDDYFKIGPLKLLTDGSLGARTAALRDDYSDDPGNRGLLTYPQDELDDLVDTAHTGGMQVFLHAIGDAAIEASINALEKAINRSPRSDARHRINHFQIGRWDLFERMARLGLIADIQPIFVSSDWSMVESRVGPQRAKASYAWKTMLDWGIPLAGGSDSPTENFNPLLGIYAAATRRDIQGNPPDGWNPEQKLSIEDAVRLFTTGPAYASFEERRKGTISEGKLADLVVLSEDPFEVGAGDIKDIEVLTTIVGGRIRHLK